MNLFMSMPATYLLLGLLLQVAGLPQDHAVVPDDSVKAQEHLIESCHLEEEWVGSGVQRSRIQLLLHTAAAVAPGACNVTYPLIPQLLLCHLQFEQDISRFADHGDGLGAYAREREGRMERPRWK